VGWTCATHALGKDFQEYFGRPNVKSPLGRPRRRWDCNTKMDLREVGIDVMN